MLKDKLFAISEGNAEQDLCLLGKAMKEMDSDTRSAFIRAMKSSASSSQIMNVMKEEGISSFGITHLRDKRRECFKQDGGCICLKEASNG